MRLDRAAGEEAAPATGRREGGAQRSSAAAKSTRRSFAPIAPSPFRAPLGCLAFLPESPVCKLADPGRSPESNRQLQASKPSLSSASHKAKKQNPEPMPRSPVSGISGVPQIPPGSPRNQTTPRKAILFPGWESPFERLVHPLGPRSPSSEGVL